MKMAIKILVVVTAAAIPVILFFKMRKPKYETFYETGGII